MSKQKRTEQVGIKLTKTEVACADEVVELLEKLYGIRVSRTDAFVYAIKFTLDIKGEL